MLSKSPSNSGRCAAAVVLSAIAIFANARVGRGDVAFDVEFSPGTDVLPFSDALKESVSAATGVYSTVFKDAATIKVLVELDSEATDFDLGDSPSVFAAGVGASEEQPYVDVASALFADAKSPHDFDSLPLLQTGPYLEALTHDTSLPLGDPGVGPGGSPEIRIGSAAAGAVGAKAEATWNSVLKVSRANSKALGLPVTEDGAPDIRLIINDEALPSFDYVRADGVSDGKFDFQAIAAHELGHGMGFVSGVDDVDYAGIGGDPVSPAPDNPLDLSGMAVFSVLDLFRTNVVTRDPGIEFGQPEEGGFVLDWRFGPPPGPFFKPFFSLDPVSFDPPEKVAFSTGAENGDGAQASHWEDAPLGLMVPDLSPGVILDLSDLDVTAFDVIGWDIVPVPEPNGFLIAVLGLGGLSAVRRRRFA
ncbi:MAG: NF038122 family metalloprotease [Planctomycetales bacterium]|nr:NF038122 family metalloprotease [Planctomycetales bacterium]